MKEKIDQFKQYWNEHYSFISMELEDYEIEDFIRRSNGDVRIATDSAADYLLSQGLADVQE